MPDAFTITAAATTVTLDDQGRGETSFTVVNATGRPLRVRAVVVPTEPAKAEWFSIAGEAERETPLAGVQQYTVRIAVPAGTPAGSYQFRLNAQAEDRPEEDYSQGPTVAFTVAEAKAPAKKFPWWIVAAAAAVVVLGIVAFLVFRDGDEQAATPTMPNVLGVPEADAVTTLAGEDIAVVESRPADPNVAIDPATACVVFTVPFPGDPVPDGEAVLGLGPCGAPPTTVTLPPGGICAVNPFFCEIIVDRFEVDPDVLADDLEDQLEESEGG